MHTRFCLCPPKVSVSSVLWKFCNQILLSFKISFLGYSQFLCLIPRLGSLMWGLESLQKCENFSDIFILQLVSHSPGGCEILFQHDYISPTILLWLLLCLWLWGIFFGGFHHLPVDGWSTASCNFGALTGGCEHSSFYSAILNKSPSCVFFRKVLEDMLYISLYI